MTLSSQEYTEFIRKHADGDGRLPAAKLPWMSFPFDAEELVIEPWQDPVLPEPERHGQDPDECEACADRDQGVWRNENWRLIACRPTGIPVLLMLLPRNHFDFADLPDDLAAEMGVILRHLATVIEGMDNIERVHADRWGDGGAHLHWFISGRPSGQLQLRGTFCAVWELILPELPQEVVNSHAMEVARGLQASFGGKLVAEPPVK